MMSDNTAGEERFLVTLLREIGKEEGIQVTGYSHDWIIEIERAGRRGFVFGYDFSLNSGTAVKIAKDKVATHLLLEQHSVPSVEHVLISSPRILKNYTASDSGNWQTILSYAKKYNNQLVCKPLNGTMGAHVFFTRTQTDIEEAIHALIAKYRDATISPWLDIEDEYRVVILDGVPMLVFRKERQQVIGDGKKTIAELVRETYGGDDAIFLLAEMGGEEREIVPQKGTVYFLSNKHNLTHGARPVVIGGGEEMYKEITTLAQNAAQAIDIRFASVDVVQVGGKLFILEINSGVTMKKFASFSLENYNKAKEIYRQAVTHLFE